MLQTVDLEACQVSTIILCTHKPALNKNRAKQSTLRGSVLLLLQRQH